MRLLALVSEGRVAMSRDDLARQRDGPTAGSPNTAWVWDSPIFSMGAANFPHILAYFSAGYVVSIHDDKDAVNTVHSSVPRTDLASGNNTIESSPA